MIVVVLLILIVIVCPLLLISTHKTVKIADNLITVNKTYKRFKKEFDKVGLIISEFEIDGEKHKFLIDTGAQNSVIDKKIAKNINEKIKSQFCGIDGEYVDNEVADVIFKINNKECKELVNVANLKKLINNIKHESGVEIAGIIGCDFLSKFNFTIDFKNKKLSFNEEKKN